MLASYRLAEVQLRFWLEDREPELTAALKPSFPGPGVFSLGPPVRVC